LRDSRGGTSANFLHTAARQNKSGGLSREKRDCADNPLDRLRIKLRKPLYPDYLSGRAGTGRDMLMDVNKRSRTRGRRCV